MKVLVSWNEPSPAGYIDPTTVGIDRFTNQLEQDVISQVKTLVRVHYDRMRKMLGGPSTNHVVVRLAEISPVLAGGAPDTAAWEEVLKRNF